MSVIMLLAAVIGNTSKSPFFLSQTLPFIWVPIHAQCDSPGVQLILASTELSMTKNIGRVIYGAEICMDLYGITHTEGKKKKELAKDTNILINLLIFY